MANPYTERMTAIAKLRVDKLRIDAQINDEIARAWMVSPAKNLKTFAAALGMTQTAVHDVLLTKGIKSTIVP